MANQSIYSAFERMWQHVVTALGKKADKTHAHDWTAIESNPFMVESSDTIRMRTDEMEDINGFLKIADFTLTPQDVTNGGYFSLQPVSGSGESISLEITGLNDNLQFIAPDDAYVPIYINPEDANFLPKGMYLTAGTLPEPYELTLSINGATFPPPAAFDASLLPVHRHNEMKALNPTGTGSFSLNRKSGTTIGNYSFAEGKDTTAKGTYSHAEGYETTASGNSGSHAEGNNTTASAESSHAEGYDTTASGISAHAEGFGSTAKGAAAHAEGKDTYAEGSYSHTEGEGTSASGYAQHVQGRYNIDDTTSLHIVGNGIESEPSNAHTLDTHGNAWFAGDVYVGSTSGTNKDEGSKKLATEGYVDSKSFSGNYNDLTNKPTIPTVGNGTVTINQNGSQVASFTLNQSGNATVNLTDTAYTHPSTHAASMITGLATVATSGSYNDLSNKPTIPTVPSTLKNPNSLTVKGNGTQSFTYDGSAAKTLNIKAGTNVSVSSDTSGNITIAATDTTYGIGNGTTAGITLVYPADKCTTFSSDSGTVTPLAVQKGAKMFAITRPASSTNKAITRYSNTTGDVQDSKIIIEDVTNTKDSSKQAQVIAIPAEGGKKMVYGYCTDQTDGTSFIGGVFDASATSYPYAEGLAIGGTSGNLLWKGAKVATVNDIPAAPTLSSLGGVPTSTKADVTLSASSWSSGNYTLSNSNITATNVVELIPSSTITAAQFEALSNAKIVGGTQAAGSIVLRALGDVPTINIPVTFVFRRDI